VNVLNITSVRKEPEHLLFLNALQAHTLLTPDQSQLKTAFLVLLASIVMQEQVLLAAQQATTVPKAQRTDTSSLARLVTGTIYKTSSQTWLASLAALEMRVLPLACLASQLSDVRTGSTTTSRQQRRNANHARLASTARI